MRSYTKDELYGTLLLSTTDESYIAMVRPITQVFDHLSVTLVTIPLCTYTAENAFCYDEGVANSYTIGFKRICPAEPDDDSDDQSEWSNKKFKDNLSGMINRWQMETDGCTIVYVPPRGADRPTIPARTEEVLEKSGATEFTLSALEGINGYISKLTFSYSAGYPDVLSGQLTLMIGSLRGSR